MGLVETSVLQKNGRIRGFDCHWFLGLSQIVLQMNCPTVGWNVITPQSLFLQPEACARAEQQWQSPSRCTLVVFEHTCGLIVFISNTFHVLSDIYGIWTVKWEGSAFRWLFEILEQLFGSPDRSSLFRLYVSFQCGWCFIQVEQDLICSFQEDSY